MLSFASGGVITKTVEDPSLFFEETNFVSNFIRKMLILPLFNLLPKGTGTYLFIKTSTSASEIYNFAKSSRALEILYNFDGKFEKAGKFLDVVFTYFWQRHFINAKAVRNRFKLVQKELYRCATEISTQEPVRILSLASGSARVVITILAQLKKAGLKAEAKLLDLNPSALVISKKIAAEFGVSNMIIEYCEDKVGNFEKYINGWRPNIIEMVGFMDYLSQSKGILITKKIYNVLPDSGYFITCNIKDNDERKFLTKVLNWDMNYRDPDELSTILVEGGFDPDYCQILYEPYKIHGIAIGKK